MIKNNLLILMAFSLAVILGCSSNETLTGGGSDTEVGSRRVAGVIVDSAGISLPGAAVVLRPADYLSDSLTDSSYRHRHTMLDTITLSDGAFILDSVKNGSYCVSVIYSDSIGALVEFSIDSTSDSVVKLPPVTAAAMAVVDGNVKVYGTDSSNCYVQLFGTEIRNQPDRNGYFSMRVPRGKHTLHISAFSKDDTIREQPMDDMDVTFEINDGYKNFGTFRLEPPPQYQCDDFSCDSVIMRKALDDMGLMNYDVRTVSIVENNRITGLSLRHINIGQLSGEVRNLTELRYIDLGATGIETVFPDIGTLRKLTTLLLDSNSISYLPSSMAGLRELKTLDLKMNKITGLPDHFVELTPSVSLDLSGNRLCKLDSVETMWANQYDPDWNMSQECQ